MRALELLEEENRALRAQLARVRGAIAELTEVHTEKASDVPFFSEAYLYKAIGKEDAGTVLSRIDSLQQTVEMTPDEAKALAEKSAALQDLEYAGAGLRYMDVVLPEAPVRPENPFSGRKIKSLTKEEREQLDAFYASKKFQQFSKQQSEYMDNPLVKLYRQSHTVVEAIKRMAEADRKVRQSMGEASIRLLYSDNSDRVE